MQYKLEHERVLPGGRVDEGEPGFVAGASGTHPAPALHQARADERSPENDTRRFRRVEPRRFLGKVLLLLLLLALTGAGTLRTHGAVRLGFQFLLALLLAHATELVHQCLHKTATGFGAWDRVFGILLGLPTLVSYYYYQFWHLWHHRKNGTVEDRESFGYAYNLLKSPSRHVRWLGFLLHLSMALHYRSAARRMCLAVRGRLQGELRREAPGMPGGVARKIQANYRLMAAGLLSSAGVSVLFRSTLLIDLWLIPLLLWGPIHALIELPEHICCDFPGPDPRKNTRSLQAGWFMCWLTNNNCNHVGHHSDMLVPMDKLVEYERHMLRRGRFKYMEKSYPSFYRRFLWFLWSGSAD
jgi:fatty acid desaturase